MVLVPIIPLLSAMVHVADENASFQVPSPADDVDSPVSKRARAEIGQWQQQQSRASASQQRQQAQQQQQQQAAAKRLGKDANLQDMQQFWKYFHLVPAQVLPSLYTAVPSSFCVLYTAVIAWYCPLSIAVKAWNCPVHTDVIPWYCPHVLAVSVCTAHCCGPSQGTATAVLHLLNHPIRFPDCSLPSFLLMVLVCTVIVVHCHRGCRGVQCSPEPFKAFCMLQP